MGSTISTRSASRRVPIASLVVLAFALALLGTSSASAITRNTVLERAQRRIDRPVPYSQQKYYAGYRTDCSGYVSSCWATGTSWNTRTFYLVTHPITVAELRPGDAMLKKGYHIRLFYGWVDDAHTSYVAYESANGKVAGCRIHSLAEDLEFGYVPTRYDHIQASPKPRNILKNSYFDTWATSWSGSESPLWWEQTGPGWQAFAIHRKSVYRSASNSLQLNNPSDDPGVFSELSQTATITPGASYRLTAYAKSAFDPAGVELALTYLNPLGEPVGERRTTGDAWAIDGTDFKRMSVLDTAPPDAVRARVTVRLAGGSTETSTGPVAGTSVILDDIVMGRPQISTTITTSRTRAYSGTSAVVSGSVTPTRTIGAPAVVWVQRPGASWTKLATSTVVASGSSATWRAKLSFTRTMRRGVYRFKTVVSEIPGYLGTTSNTVSVTLR